MSVGMLHDTRLSNAAQAPRGELTGDAVIVAVVRLPDQLKSVSSI